MVITFFWLSGCASGESIADTSLYTPTPSSTAIETATATQTPTITYSPTITVTPTITLTPTITRTPTITPTPTMITGPAPTLAAIDTYFITNGDRDSTLVALTFDICESETVPSGYDAAIEAALVELEAPATFFISGHWMAHNVETVRRLANNPLFEIGNHSWSHPDFRELDAVQLDSQIVQANDIFYQLTGQQMQYFRLPGGMYYPWILDAIAEHGMLTIQWDVVTGDPVPDNDAENINRIVQDRVQNGSIIIMHANGRGWHTAEALPDMIDWLREQGYTLVTISDLLDVGE